MNTVNSAYKTGAEKGKTSKELKSLARGAILGSLTVCVCANFLYGMFGLILDYIVGGVITGSGFAAFALNIVFTFLVTLMMGIFQAGLSLIYLKKTFGQDAAVSDLFYGFKESPDRIIKLQAVLGAMQIAAVLPAQIYISFVFKGDLLTAIAALQTDSSVFYGFILRYGVLTILGFAIQIAISAFFGLSYYILLDFPQLSTKEILMKSMELMRDVKGKYILIELSFIPLYILGFISFGIGDLWVMAYENAVIAEFYRDRIENT